MLLQVHSDASFMNETKARPTADGHFFLGNKIKPNRPIYLNGPIHVLCKVLDKIAASAAEAELGSLFLNVQETIKFRIALEELGHPQPATPIHTDNSCAASIIHQSIKQQRSRAMNLRYFWTIEKQKDKTIDVSWHPGTKNMADYVSKHHIPTIHTKRRPLFLHTKDSPQYLP